jgi:hypothetical protein
MRPKGAVIGLASLAASALLKRRTTPRRIERTTHSIEPQLHNYVLFVATPIWIAAGLLDYIWHRRTRIETTAGTKESALHLLMLTEAAPIALAPLLFEINAGALLLMLSAFAAHEATAAWDVSMAAPRRLIEPAEQHIHGVLELMPFCVASIYAATHWEKLRSIFGRPRAADFRLRLKQPRASPAQVAGLVSAITLFDFLPHVEELWRCRVAERKGLTGRDTPECAETLYGDG